VTGVGFSGGFTVGFALADLLGVGMGEALLDADVAEGAALDEPAPEAALDAAALETAAVEAALETAGEAEEAATPALPGAPESVPSGAAWW
jgi:hypothetical protein